MKRQGGYQVLGKGHQALSGKGAEHLEEKSITARGKMEHIWIAIPTYIISDESLRKITTDQLILDSENLIQISVGCFNCELQFQPRLLGTVCKGEPLTSIGTV